MTAMTQAGSDSTPQALQLLYRQFGNESSSDGSASRLFARWARARAEWRTHWADGARRRTDAVLQMLVPSPASASERHWVHPVAESAPELESWWRWLVDASAAERDELTTAFLRTVSLIQHDGSSAADAYGPLAQSATGRRLPLAALTPALSALDPARFVPLCEQWVQLIGRYQGAELAMDISSCGELNAIALRWLAAAEGDAVPAALAGHPLADRFGVFCAWAAATNVRATTSPRFNVARRKYQDWPPMW